MQQVKARPRRQWLPSAALLLICLVAAETHARSVFEGEGRVVALDRVRGTVTLDHGPVSGLMPAMRMEFPVQRLELFEQLQLGAQVRFSLQPRGFGWAIATVELTSPRQRAGRVIFPAPDFTLPTLAGESVRLADLRGKAVLLNFWATWCAPCRRELPALEALYQRYRNRGLEVVAVDLDVLSTAGLEAFLRDVRVTFRVLRDPEWATAHAYQVFGLPTTYLIDRAGNVVAREIGERTWTDSTSQAAVEELLR